jgi:hypothetical protein
MVKMFNSAYRVVILFSSFFFVSCSFLKLDPETNCLNDKAGCFKEDKTRPQLAVNGALYPLQGEVISTLGHVDLLFTEELNNPQPSDFVFSGAANMTVNAVQQLNKFTYRLLLTQNSLTSGPIFLDFPNLKDYNGNKITGSTTVSYVGNVNIPITLNSVSHYGVSNNGGYAQIDVSWRYVYLPPSTPPNSTIYTVRLTTGSEDCNAGTPITPSASSVAVGTAVASYDSTDSTTIANTTHTFSVDTSVITSLGAQKILICVANVVQNKYGAGIISLVRDDSPPLTNLTPAAGFYASPRTLTFNCSDNADKVIFTSATTVGTGIDPLASAAADPTFNTTTGAVITGTLYNVNAKPPTPYSADPTHTIYKYRCIDQAGNIEAIRTSGVYRVDSTFPTVTLAHVYKSGTTVAITGVSSGAFAYQSADFVWRTNQVNKYWELRVNATSCGAGGTVVTSGLTTGTANAENTTPIAYNATGIAVGENPLLLCVGNNTTAGTSTVWGQESFSLLRDDTAPSTPVVNIAGGNYGSRPSLVFSCSDNQDKVAFTTATAVGSGVPTTPALPDFDLNGITSVGDTYSEPIQPLDATTTTYRWRCIDRAGNKSVAAATATYRIDSILPTITIVSNSRDHLSSVAGYNSTTLSWRSTRGGLPFEIRRNSTNCIDGTLLSSPANVSGTTNADINQNNVSTFDIGNFAAEGEYTLMICVRNFIDQWGFTYKTIRRDNTAPTFAGLTSLTSGSAGTFTLHWSLAGDGSGSGIAYYNIYRATSAAGPFTSVSHVAAHPNPSITVTVPDPLLTYYFVAGAVDNAGNETKVVASPLSTKPEIRLVVSGLDAGKSFTFTDGTGATAVISSNASAPGTLFASSIALGQTYALNINAHPVGQICGIRQRQFGILSGDLTVMVICVDGVMVGGRYQDKPAAPMGQMLYRTSAVVHASSYSSGSLGNPNSLTVAGSNVYFGSDLDCETGAGVSYCLYSVPTGGSTVTAVLTGLTGVVRGITSDGVSLYFTMLAPENKLYKVLIGSASPVEIASGFSNPFGVAIDGVYVYVADKGANAIVRVDLRTGTKTNVVTGLASGPTGLTVVDNYLYITLDGSHAIYRALKAGGSASVFAGSAALSGREDAAGISARLNMPHDLLFDGYDNLYFTEYGGHYVRRLRLSTGRVTTLAGDGISGLYTNGTGPTTRLASPVGIGSDGRRMYITLHGPDKRIIRLEESGSRGYWPLHVNTELRDYNGQNATTNDMAWASGIASYVTDRFGKETAIQFNGTNTQLQATSPITVGGLCNVSAAVWFKPNNPVTGNAQVIFHNGNSGSSGYGLLLDDKGALGLLFGGVGGIGSGVYAVANQWMHAAIVCRGSNIWSLYVNGHLMARGDGSASQRPNANVISQIFVGKGAGGATEYFTGAISDLRLYTRGLSEAEVSELAQDADENLVGKSYNRRATELLSHYEFDAHSSGDGGALNHTLTNSAAGPVDGKEGDYPGAVGLDGTAGSFLEQSVATGLPFGAQPRTVCAFVKPNRQPGVGSRYPIVSFGSTGSLFKATELVYYSPALNDYRISLTKIGDSVDASFTLPLRSWSHVCATNDGATTRLYVEGTELPAVSGNAQVFDTPHGVLRIGKRVYNADVFNFNGHIDDVRIYNKALTAFEIRLIAKTVPAGLVHHYDFSGDTEDVSGFMIQLTNNDASPTDNRFGLNSSAYKFNGSSGSLSSGGIRNANNFITMAAWISPVSTNTQTGIVSNWSGIGGGLGGTGGGLILDGAGRLAFLAKGNGGDSDCFTSWVPPRDVYSHVAASVDANSFKVLVYANGTEVGNCNIGAGKPEFRNNEDLRIAKHDNLFAGSIDDVRIYNRALTATEIRALVQHANKRIFVSNSQPTGSLGGIAGADAICDSDTAKPNGAKYKAMLVNGSTRRACSAANCSSSGLLENIDWVLQPQVTYVQAAGVLPVFTANTSAIYPFGTFTNAISGTAVYAWTGLTTGWQVGNSLGVDLDCGDWNGGVNGAIGQVDALTSSAAYSTTDLCPSARRLYCVEQ